MRFGNLSIVALAISAAAQLTPALAAQEDAKGVGTRRPVAAPALTVRAISPGPGTVTLQWEAVKGADSYRIERHKVVTEVDSRSGTMNLNRQYFVIVDRHPTNTYADTGLWDDTTYYYRVTAALDYAKAGARSQIIGEVRVTTAP